jgi:hypothetical protein
MLDNDTSSTDKNKVTHFDRVKKTKSWNSMCEDSENEDSRKEQSISRDQSIYQGSSQDVRRQDSQDTPVHPAVNRPGMVATRVRNQRASPIVMQRWTLGLVSRNTAVATCGEVTGLLCIKKITQQLNTSLIISNNKLDHNQPNCRIMSAMKTILNTTDMLRGTLINQKHGELLVGLQMDCGHMGIWWIC